MNMKITDGLKPTKRKIFIFSTLVVAIFGLPMMLGFVNLSLWQGFGFYIWVPLFAIYISLTQAFRVQVQDVLYCRFFACEGVAFAITAVMVLVFFYALASFIDNFFFKRQK